MPLVELPERDHAHDAGMAEAGEHAAFASEAGLLTGIDAGDGDDLERDGRARHLVDGAIDDPYTAASNLSLDDEAPCEEPLERRHRHDSERITGSPVVLRGAGGLR